MKISLKKSLCINLGDYVTEKKKYYYFKTMFDVGIIIGLTYTCI